MECDDPTTDDDATEDEEEKNVADVTSGSHDHVNNVNETSVTKLTKRKSNSIHKVKGMESKCLDFRDETTLKVWCKGQTCLAPYSGDDEYYEALISSIQKTSSGQREAVVTFIGYESEGTEVVPVSVLRTIIKPSNDTTMTDAHGNIIKMDTPSSSRKKTKGKLNVSIQHNRRLLGNGKCKRKRNSSVIVRECEEGQYERTDDNSLKLPAKPLTTSFDDANKEDDEKEFDNEMIADGFDDQDMERPSFTEPAPHPSVPLLLSQPGIQPVIQIPATINRYLRDYQRDGVRFLFQHFTENNGAILGDDMGLGKTVQVIAFIAAILGKTGTKADVFCKFMDSKTKRKQKEEVSRRERGTFLIVSPGSVMYNWKEELETWGHFNTGLFHANTKEDTLQRTHRGRLDVVLTTYETMRNHLDELNKIKWLAVIMDEVQRLKDRKAKITVAAKALKVKRRYGLTGTPLQNKLQEFWCVLDWANPGSLGKVKKFDREFDKPIREGQTYDATKRELALGRKKSKDLQKKIGKCLLRRTKDLIADQLPNKDELVVFCPLTSFQEDVYQTLLQHPDVELIRKKNFPCDCGSGADRGKCCHMLSSDDEGIKTVTMRFFQLLLKVANHAALLASTVKQTLDQQEKAKDLCLRVFSRYPEFTGCAELSSFEVLSDPKYCGKMKVLNKLLGMSKDEQSKVLLFSRSTQILDILEEFVISKGLVYSRLDGATRPADRTRLVREFNLDPSISLCLISTKAGGLGLNFTGANIVIIFDPNWNPSSDLQAQDRAYRIGQRRDVRVYRLISSGTIEEMIYLRQVYKQQLANIALKGTNERRYFTGVEGDKDRHGELFGLENLFSYRAEGASLSKDIVKRTEKIEAGYKVTKYEIVPEKKEVETEVAKESVNPNFDDDPYNLEEIASQLIDDEDQRDLTQNELSNHSSVVNKQGKDMNNDQQSLCALENNDSSFSDYEDLLQEVTAYSKTAVPKCVDSSTNYAARKRVCSDVSSSCEEVNVESKPLQSNFTRIKEKGRKIGAATEESFDVIPPTASSDDDEESTFNNSEENSSEITSSSEEDSDEGLFTRPKEKRKPAIVVCTEPSDLLKEGRKRFRRFPGKKTSNIEISCESVTAKRSKKDNTVEHILESCGVHYTHVNRHIVGPSEAENHMTKQALQDVFELRQFSQQPANCFVALETSDESDDLGESAQNTKAEVKKPSEQPEAWTSRSNPPSLNRSSRTDGGSTIERIGNTTVFIGSTPRGIRRQHFREMSDQLGFSSAVDFAKAVVQSSGTERCDMLKRYYLDKNPVLSALSSFTGCDGKSAVDNQREDFKRTKRSLERNEANESHETSKKSKRNLQKGRRKVKVLGKDAIREENLERHEIQQRDRDGVVSRKRRYASAASADKRAVKLRNSTKVIESKDRSNDQSCLSAVSADKRAVKLKNSTKVIESKDCSNDPAKNNEEEVSSVNFGNCGIEAKSRHLHQSPPADGKCSLKESAPNRDCVTKNQDLSLDSTAGTSLSILDEFLSNDSCNGGVQSKNASKIVGKVKSCSDKKRDDYFDKKIRKEAVKNPTSVLDEFI